MEDSYEEKAAQLSKVIDIALDSLHKFPPPSLDAVSIELVNKFYISTKHEIENPLPEYRNSKTLSSTEVQIFTIFRESSGQAVEYFWKSINNEKLEYSRYNPFFKILKRRKIKSQYEYDIIIDLMNVYKQEGLISEVDNISIGTMISEYELKINK